ncbi:hypothetical protein ElyMa_004138500 [Elysia marginata]|uniref:Uncharacterized protein n=1 Tax=Elysia marginata TaxID=1093978 RepID=A0AAV4GEX4_9GAST|nr:hypothetical protein ElyMa_004138500 [Elysia marginata]
MLVKVKGPRSALDMQEKVKRPKINLGHAGEGERTKISLGLTREGGVLGAQRIGALRRTYLRSPQAWATLLAQGLCIGGRTVMVSSQNPSIVRGPDGEEISGTRLTILDVPISFSNAAIESPLVKKDIKLRSRLRMEEIREKQGRLTKWWSGRRFAYIDLPKSNIEKILQVGPFKAKLYYREMTDTNLCFSCQRLPSKVEQPRGRGRG